MMLRCAGRNNEILGRSNYFNSFIQKTFFFIFHWLIQVIYVYPISRGQKVLFPDETHLENRDIFAFKGNTKTKAGA